MDFFSLSEARALRPRSKPALVCTQNFYFFYGEEEERAASGSDHAQYVKVLWDFLLLASQLTVLDLQDHKREKDLGHFITDAFFETWNKFFKY